MKKFIFIFAVLIFSMGTSAEAYELQKAVLTTEIVDREPTAPTESFTLYSKGYFYTEFIDVGEGQTIHHNWYFMEDSGEKTLTASVPLYIVGERWRTWSSKNLYLAGKWRIEVVDQDKNLITSADFTVD